MSDMHQPLPVTVIVPTRNEESNLRGCLSSLGSYFQEVVIIDSASTDATRQIAEVWGARVIDFVWNGEFPKKRNWVLLNYGFKTPWVLFLDADERVTKGFCEELRAKISSASSVGYWLNYMNYFQGKALKYGIAQKKLALFRVGAGLFERIDDPGWADFDMEVHEHPELYGDIGEIFASIDHCDFRGLHHFVQRHNQYASWEAQRYLALKRGGRQTRTVRQELKYKYIERWWFPFVYFVLTYVICRGFLDGRTGFVYAAMKSMYYLQIQEKIAEQQGKLISPRDRGSSGEDPMIGEAAWKVVRSEVHPPRESGTCVQAQRNGPSCGSKGSGG